MDSPTPLSAREEEIEHHDRFRICPTHLESLTDRHKTIVLIQIFSGIMPSEIKRTVNKCKGNTSFAMDLLLDQAFGEDSGSQYQRTIGVKEGTLRRLPQQTSQDDMERKAPGAVSNRWTGITRCWNYSCVAALVGYTTGLFYGFTLRVYSTGLLYGFTLRVYSTGSLLGSIIRLICSELLYS